MIDLSIIIVSYNTQPLLRDCLASVYENLGSLDAEIIVIDNASSDGSPEMVAKEFPLTRLVSNSENIGFAAANNQGLRESESRYVLLLNSDTVVLGDVLPASISYMDSHQDIGVLGCRVLNSDGTLQLTCSQIPSMLNLILLTSGLSQLNWPRGFGRYQMKHWDRLSERDVPVVSGCYMVVRREAIVNVGMLDEDFFFFGEETDWCARFLQAGWRVSFAPIGEIVHHGSASAVTLGHKRDLLLTSGLVRYHRKHGGITMAVLVWLLLYVFSISRWLYWASVSILTRTRESRDRRRYFFGIARDFRRSWPRGQ